MVKPVEGLTLEMEQQFKEENKFFVNHLNNLNKHLKYVHMLAIFYLQPKEM